MLFRLETMLTINHCSYFTFFFYLLFVAYIYIHHKTYISVEEKNMINQTYSYIRKCKIIFFVQKKDIYIKNKNRRKHL